MSIQLIISRFFVYISQYWKGDSSMAYINFAPGIGERIKSIRKENNLNQKEFAEIIGVTQPHVSNIEKEDDFPSEKAVDKIHIAFNISKEWIINGVGDKNSILSGKTKYIEGKIKNLNENFKKSLLKWDSLDGFPDGYIKAVESLYSILSLFDDDLFDVDSGLLQNYYTEIGLILNELEFIVLHYKEIKEGMSDKDKSMIQLHQNDMKEKICNHIKSIISYIFEAKNEKPFI